MPELSYKVHWNNNVYKFLSYDRTNVYSSIALAVSVTNLIPRRALMTLTRSLSLSLSLSLSPFSYLFLEIINPSLTS